MANKVKPIKPSEAVKEKKAKFPDAVLEAFNELIAKNLVGCSSVVKQKDVMKLMVAKGLSCKEIYENGYLNVEDVYRKAGWRVVYDKPGYDENYDAFFEFTPATRRV